MDNIDDILVIKLIADYNIERNSDLDLKKRMVCEKNTLKIHNIYICKENEIEKYLDFK